MAFTADVKAGGAYVEISGQIKPLEKSLNQASGMMTNWAKGAMGALGIGLGGAAIFEGIKSSVEAAASAEQSQIRLAAALKLTGHLTEESFRDAMDYAAGLSHTTHYTHQQIEATMALGAQIGNLSGKELKNATRAAIGWGQIMGVDSTEAMRIMVSAVNGARNPFKRYGIDVQTTTDAHQRMNMLIQASEGGFQMEQALLSGTAGSVSEFGKAWDEAKVQFGTAFVAGSGLNEMMMAMSDNLEDGTSSATEFGLAVGHAFTGIVALGQTAASVIRSLWEGLMWGVGNNLKIISAIMYLIPGLKEASKSVYAFGAGLQTGGGERISQSWSATGTAWDHATTTDYQKRQIESRHRAQRAARTHTAGAYAHLPDNLPGVMPRAGEEPEEPVAAGMVSASAYAGGRTLDMVANSGAFGGGGKPGTSDDEFKQLLKQIAQNTGKGRAAIAGYP